MNRFRAKSRRSVVPDMTVECPKCHARYSLREGSFPGPIAQARCAKCHNSFRVTTAAVKEASPVPLATEATQIDSGYLKVPADKAIALSITHGPMKGDVFHLTKVRNVLGRTAGADIVISDPKVSHEHCAVEVHDDKGTARLVDLESTNGTYVDEQKIKNCELNHLSEFRIGSTTLLFTVTQFRR
jgi:predicted Zn finger-like uncharacterized protein